MASTYEPQSPRPTRSQIFRVFGSDPDFARKVEKIFDDIINAAAASNANAAEIDGIQEQTDTVTAMVAAASMVARAAVDMAEAAEQWATMVQTLNARLTAVEREISDLKEAPL